ncbi:MAG: hypothetical protein ACK5IQ_06080 [Bacteroidales bacterium]
MNTERLIAERTVFEIVSRYLQGKLNNVIAHELGHGKFKLRHTFDNFYGGVLEEGTTDNLMDYTKDKTELAKWQWNKINTPALFVNPFEGNDKSEKLLEYFSSVSSKDQEIYQSVVNELRKNNIFNKIYGILDTSSTFVAVLIRRAEIGTLQEFIEQYGKTLGYFDPNVSTKDDYIFGIIPWGEILPGDKENPYSINLLSSHNPEDTNNKVGTSFDNGDIIFEEFFHAAHYLYLKSIGKFKGASFFTQTEIEVDMVKRYVESLIVEDKAAFKNSYTGKWINYGLPESIDLYNFPNRTDTKSFGLEKLLNLSSMVYSNKKQKGYPAMDFNKLDLDFDFIRYLLDLK